MFFSAKFFSEQYKLLNNEEEGKVNIERTSGLSYFLAIDMLQKEHSQSLISIPPRSPMRLSFLNSIGKILVLGENEDGMQYQANHLGLINLNNISIAERTSKNFLSTQLHRASQSSVTADYPTRPSNGGLLVLGIGARAADKFGIEKHINWRNNLLKYIDFRLCKNDTFPLIVFLLRNKDFVIEHDFKEALSRSLKEIFTDDVANYLISNARIPDINHPESGEWFDEENWDIGDLDSSLFKETEETEEMGEIINNQSELPKNPIGIEVPRNRILYGAPGTGKSNALNKEVLKYFPSNDLSYRITFHSKYTYNHFVGSLRPVSLYRESPNKLYDTDKITQLEGNLEPVIDYRFIPGPFLEMLVKAFQNPDTSFVLIIEEINRANTASVFGDIFQLLDRNEEGTSDYSIILNNDAMAYLRSKGIMTPKIKLPSNLFLWATMNNADQGVFPVDTAFKRRWSFEYIRLNQNQEHMKNEKIKLPFLDVEISWNKFRGIINDHLKPYVPEDKLLGPFFLKAYELQSPDAIANKLLFYLREDVLRHNPEVLFTKKIFSDIIEDYYDGQNIFRLSKEVFLNEE